MRVISTPHRDIDPTTLDAFRLHLVKRDLAPATVTAYLDDLHRFWAWLCDVHDGRPPPIDQARTVDLAAFRTHLIHEQAQTPATVNRRIQGLRLGLGHMTGYTFGKPYLPTFHMAFKANITRVEVPTSIKESCCGNMAIRRV